MRILFTLYSEDYETANKNLFFTKLINTNLDLKEIDGTLQLYDGFHSTLEGGENILFWDIYSYSADLETLRSKIIAIPTSDEQTFSANYPKVLIIEDFRLGPVSTPNYPVSNTYYLIHITRYEYGADSYKAIVMWASSHPWLMVFIGGLLWDMTKWLGAKVRKRIKSLCGLNNGKGTHQEKRIAFFATKQFYHYFEQMTSIKKTDCQIVFLNRKTNNDYTVHVRTIHNDKYILRCKCTGKIFSLKIDTEK